MDSNVAAFSHISVTKSSSNFVEISWEFNGEFDVFKIKKLEAGGEWKSVYWGRQNSTRIENLPSNTCHYLEISALKEMPNSFSPVASEFFKAATTEETTQLKAFHRAITRSQIKLVKDFLKLNPEMIDVPFESFTPLGLAVNANDYYMSKMLLEYGASPDIGIPELKRSPLHMSIFNKNMDITELLLKYKADVRVKDIFGLSIAHHAIDANDTNTLMYCLEKGIHTETRDNFGNTLLLRAIISNASINLIKMLLDNKASTTAKDKRNLSVLYHVRLKNNDELVELLFNYKPKTKTNVKQKISQTIQRIIVTQKIKTDADDESDIDESYDMFN